MSRIKHRFRDRIRQINCDSECFLTENLERLPIESKKINELNEKELIEKIKTINLENEIIRRENLLFSRYLLRINSTKIVQTFDEYEDGNNIILEILNEIKLSNTTPHFSFKKTKKRTSTWTKVSINCRDYMYAPHILCIEQERLSIAAYEIQQTHLERERMKANAMVVLDNLQILYQAIESDEIVQKTLNRDIEQRVKKYFTDINEEKFHSSDGTFPVERIISHINKHIHSCISLIGHLCINTIHLYTHIEDINTRMNFLDDLMDEIDIVVLNTKTNDNIKIYEKLVQTYQIEKSFQYPLFYLVQHLYHGPERVKQEYQFSLKENQILKDRIDCIIKVPTITDYAQVIKQTKVLQHQIDIWTKRVNIVETLLLQLKRQTQPPRILPLLEIKSSTR